MIKDYLIIFFISMLPVVELRGAIPVGVGMGLPVAAVFAVSVIGNIVPVPFIILFIRKICEWMIRAGGFLERIVLWLESKAKKGSQLFYKYELLGLFILVAIPLPGTGAWTGALVAAMLDLRLKTAIPVIAAGVVSAGLIMLILSSAGFAIFG